MDVVAVVALAPTATPAQAVSRPAVPRTANAAPMHCLRDPAERRRITRSSDVIGASLSYFYASRRTSSTPPTIKATTAYPHSKAKPVQGPNGSVP